MKFEVFRKEYTDESLVNLAEDIAYMYMHHKDDYKKIPEDEDGFKLGTFTVTIVWNND